MMRQRPTAARTPLPPGGPSLPAIRELAARPQWVVWRFEPREGGKPAKRPFDPRTGTAASVTDPATWATYEEARGAATSFEGVGFVVTPEDPFAGVDLDGCRDPQTGAITPWAKAITDRLTSYTEVSPSGTGLRVWVRGSLPPGGRVLRGLGDDGRGATEVYDERRYFAITGDSVPGTPTTIEDRQAELTALHEELFGAPSSNGGPLTADRAAGAALTDDGVIERASKAANGAKFRALWAGEWQAAGHPSQSEADLALTNLLTFWVGADAERIDRLFRRSGLLRPKWDESRGGRTYGALTIAKAIASGNGQPDGDGVEPESTGGQSTGWGGSPEKPPPSSANTSEAVPGPSLLTPAEREEVRAHEERVRDRDFVRRWVAYGESRTDAPVAFHEAAALVLVAAAIDRSRWLDLEHKTVYPSLYALLLAGSGLRKSTPLTYGKRALLAAFPERLLANEYSPEALIADLAERKPSRGTALVDEAGRLLGTMRRDRYGEGLKDLLAELWDAPDQLTRRLMKARYDLRETYVNLVLATTPSRFAEVCTREDVASGFLARFLPILVTGPSRRKPIKARTPETDATERRLIGELVAMRDRVAQAPGPVSITPEALARLDEAEVRLETWAAAEFQSDLLAPWARRLAEYGARLAIIFADSEEAEQVERVHVLRALAVLDRAWVDARTLIDELVKDQEARELDRVQRFIAQRPGITGRELQRAASLRAARVESLTVELEKQGRLRIERQGSTPRYYPVPAMETVQ